MSLGPDTGPRGADAVGEAAADSWAGHDGRAGACGGGGFGLRQRLDQGMLNVEQRQPQGREAFLLTGRSHTTGVLTYRT